MLLARLSASVTRANLTVDAAPEYNSHGNLISPFYGYMPTQWVCYVFASLFILSTGKSVSGGTLAFLADTIFAIQWPTSGRLSGTALGGSCPQSFSGDLARL